MTAVKPLPDSSVDLIVGLLPQDLSASRLEGKWCSLSQCEGMNVILITGAGGAGEDPVITLEQARDANGLGAKALNITRAYWKATDESVWVEIAQFDRDNPGAIFDTVDQAGGSNAAVFLFYVRATDLDHNAGFSHLRMVVEDVGSTLQLGMIVYVPAQTFRKTSHLT